MTSSLSIQLSNTSIKKAASYIPLFEEEFLKNSRKALENLSLSHKKVIKTFLRNIPESKIGIYTLFTNDQEIILVHILGKKEDTSTRSARETGETIKSIAEKKGIENLNVFMGSLWRSEPSIWKAFCEGVYLGTYEFLEYKGKKFTEKQEKEKFKPLKNINIIDTTQKINSSQLESLKDATKITKDLINTPPSIATPDFFENYTKNALEKIKGITITVLKEKELLKEGAGGILGVGQASDQESRFLILEYKGGKKEAPIALVGKGVTYDTGGLSLKPARYMSGMKEDLGGAATVTGAFYYLAKEGIKKNIVAVIPLAENLIGNKAYKPDDVLTMMNGKTVEITNTDAEGRLLLADALTYAEKTFSPRAIVDLATLTGACEYAVGNDFTAGLSNNPKLFSCIKSAAHSSDEPVWELPLHSKYESQIESPIADLVNSSDQLKAGTIEGGLFLQNFVTKDTPWCHLDIAAVTSNSKTQAASGRNVRLLFDFIQSY